MDAIECVGEGRPGTPLGAADICTALWARHLKFFAADPLWFDRDRFVLSAGHGSMLLYSLLHLTGHPGMEIDALRRFRELGSPCEGHPEYAPTQGVEVTTGLLGQGVANAAGMALAEAFLSQRLGADLVDHRTWVLSGDGCLQEGIAHEIAALAGHLRLSKLTWFWDDNRMTDDGDIGLALSEDYAARFRAAHWHVQEVDGHDVDAVDHAIALAKRDPRPSFIACRTVIGRGLPGVKGTRAGHSARISRATTDAARWQLDWPYPPFTQPNDIAAAWDDAGARGQSDHGWKISGDIVERAAAAIAELLTSAPDLEGATQHKRGLAAFTAEDRAGRYVHYGVREHAMGAMLVGMAAWRRPGSPISSSPTTCGRCCAFPRRCSCRRSSRSAATASASAGTAQRTSPWSISQPCARSRGCVSSAPPMRSRPPSAGSSLSRVATALPASSSRASTCPR